MSNLHKDISALCADLGNDRLLVQGAGGNVSWKEDGLLWVKGSGTWLANANKEDIFLPVDLNHLQNALDQANFGANPQEVICREGGKLRPSIETLLHALMPQKVVVHLHALNVLSYLVQKDCMTLLQDLIAQSPNAHHLSSIFVDYHKPGPDLARAIHKSLQSKKNTNIIFLKNHGIVIGADSIVGIKTLLELICSIFAPKHNPVHLRLAATSQVIAPEGYIYFEDRDVQDLALDPDLYKRLQSDWVLFPDHAVFLGPKAFVYSSLKVFEEQEKNNPDKPELVFIKNIGVFVKPDFNQAKAAQLLCYYDVIARVTSCDQLDPLNENSIHELLNWDAEKHRKSMMK